ncbi:hydroxypyruvate isomerase family protein [Actinomadura flavalba]|uniref:hydroxypyruvate isomerase family protein n=1 Tax=Actinomadura flavalba TaxID=1120938 RepID=UPI00037DA6E9|nr:TIM barrel protein [Actinomadura flavalba]
MRFAVNGSILFTELPLLDRPAAIAASGFDAVEFWWPWASPVPDPAEVDEFCAALASAGVRLVALNGYAGDMAAGERGVLSDPARIAEFRASVPVLASVAERTGAARFNLLYGTGGSDAVADANLAYAASVLPGTVLLEPLSQVPGYPLRTAADVVAVLDRVDLPDAALLFDTYHLTENGDDLLKVVAEYGGRVGHVQVADSPGRGRPGTGSIDFPSVFAALADAGYDGPVSLEYLPGGPSADAFGWLAR